MAIDTSQLRRKAREIGPRLRHWSSLHRFWLESGGVTLLALLMLAVIGNLALRRANAWEAQGERLRALERGMSGIITDFVPPDSVEAAEWRRSETALRELAAASVAPLATANLIARRAEEAGIYSTRVTLVANDTLDVPGSVQAAGWSAATQPTTILVHLLEGPGATARLIGTLPPNVEVASVRIEPSGPLLRSELRLVARQIEAPA